VTYAYVFDFVHPVHQIQVYRWSMSPVCLPSCLRAPVTHSFERCRATGVEVGVRSNVRIRQRVAIYLLRLTQCIRVPMRLRVRPRSPSRPPRELEFGSRIIAWRSRSIGPYRLSIPDLKDGPGPLCAPRWRAKSEAIVARSRSSRVNVWSDQMAGAVEKTFDEFVLEVEPSLRRALVGHLPIALVPDALSETCARRCLPNLEVRPGRRFTFFPLHTL
jgi:hypothetical protein